MIPRLQCLIALLLVTACGAGPTVDNPDVGSSGDLEVIVPPGLDGELPPDLMVGCRSGPVFPYGALAEITPLAEGDPGGVAGAIDPFLHSEEGVFWPQEGWLILHRTEDEILLVNATESPDLAFMTATRAGGGWNWSGAQAGGPCPLYYTVPEGLNTVEWRLDPSAPAPAADSTELAVLLTETECVSGQEIGDRLVGPQIVMTDTRLFLAFAATPPGGDAFNCQGNPETPHVVELPEPLGSRKIIESHRIGISLEDYLP